MRKFLKELASMGEELNLATNLSIQLRILFCKAYSLQRDSKTVLNFYFLLDSLHNSHRLLGFPSFYGRLH